MGSIQKDFWASDTFSANRAPIFRQDWHYLQTDRNKHPLGPRHLGVPSGASKTISKPIVRLVQTVYLSCIKISAISKTGRIVLPHEPHHRRVPLGMAKMISEPVGCLVQTVLLSCTDTNTITKWTENKILLEPRHLGVPSGASTNDFQSLWYVWRKLYTYLAMTLTLCPNRLKMRFYLSPVTWNFHGERPKGFLSIWYIQCKPCPYLASRLALSPNRPKRASTWASSPRSTIRCVQNNF
jgi:hypothetical protein